MVNIQILEMNIQKCINKALQLTIHLELFSLVVGAATQISTPPPSGGTINLQNSGMNLQLSTNKGLQLTMNLELFGLGGGGAAAQNLIRLLTSKL